MHSESLIPVFESLLQSIGNKTQYASILQHNDEHDLSIQLRRSSGTHSWRVEYVITDGTKLQDPNRIHSTAPDSTNVIIKNSSYAIVVSIGGITDASSLVSIPQDTYITAIHIYNKIDPNIVADIIAKLFA